MLSLLRKKTELPLWYEATPYNPIRHGNKLYNKTEGMTN